MRETLCTTTFLVCFCEFGKKEGNGGAGSVVGDYGKCRVRKVAVRIHDGDDENTRIICFLGCMFFMPRIDNKKSVGAFCKFGNAFETLRETRYFAVNANALKFRVLLREVSRFTFA